MARIIIPIVTVLVAVVSVGTLMYQAHVEAGIDSRSLTAGIAAGVAGASLLGLAVLEYAQWRDRRRRRQYRERPGGPVHPLVPPVGSLLLPVGSLLPPLAGAIWTDPAAPLRTDQEAR